MTWNATTDEYFVIPGPILFILQFIIPYGLLIFMPIGIFGNLASLYIFYKKRKEDRVSAQYLSVLAVFDLISISYVGIPIWLFVNLETITFGKLKYQTQMPTDVWCKVTAFTWNVCCAMSGWILIIFSTERLLVIWQPLKMAPLVASGKPRKLALVCIFLMSVTVSIGHIIWDKLIPITNGKPLPAKCKFDHETFNSTFPVLMQNFSGSGFANGIPLILITVINILILITLKHNRMSQVKNTSKTDTRAVMNLMLISLFFVIFITPFVVMYCAQAYLELTGRLDLARNPGFVQLWLTADTIHYYNFSVNPFLYVWGLDFYRKEILKIFGCGKKTRDHVTGTTRSST